MRKQLRIGYGPTLTLTDKLSLFIFAVGFSLIEEMGLTDGEQQPGHVWRSFMSSCQKSSLPSQ